MRHYLFQRTLPFTGCTRTGTAVWTEFACILVICLLCVHQRDCAAAGGIFAGEHHITRHFFHSQVTDVTCISTNHSLDTIPSRCDNEMKNLHVPRGPLHVGQQESFGLQFVQTRCPLWHCRIGGST